MTTEDIKNRITMLIEPNFTDIADNLKPQNIDHFIYEIVKGIHIGIENFKLQQREIRQWKQHG